MHDILPDDGDCTHIYSYGPTYRMTVLVEGSFEDSDDHFDNSSPVVVLSFCFPPFLFPTQRCSPLWVLQEHLVSHEVFLTERWQNKHTAFFFSRIVFGWLEERRS